MSRIDDLKDQERALYKARIELALLESLLPEAEHDVEFVDELATKKPYIQVRHAEALAYDTRRRLKAACDERRHVIYHLDLSLLKARRDEYFAHENFVPGEAWKGIIDE